MVTIRGGRGRLRVEITRTELVVLLEDVRGQVRCALPYPRAGYGGHELVVSPGEHYLALFLYSGQSENGYELFALEPELRHLGGLPYVFGEGNAPVFSPDERWVALASAVNPSLDPGDGSGSEPSIEWAEVRAQELPSGPIALCTVSVRLGVGAEQRDDDFYPEELRFAPPGMLGFRAPWGVEVTLPLPLPDTRQIAGPPA